MTPAATGSVTGRPLFSSDRCPASRTETTLRPCCGPVRGVFAGAHAMQEMAGLDFERLLEVDARKQDVPGTMEQLIVVDDVVVHPLAGLRHPIDPLVQHAILSSTISS